MAIFGTTGNDVKDGTDLADSMFGLTGDDKLHGKGGNDLLFGDDGNDLLFGGLGVGRDSDLLNGGSGIDTVTYGQVQHDMFLSLTTGQAASGDNPVGGVVDTLVSIENVIGTNFDDFLAGNGFANSLSGSGGNDGLEGGAGKDKLSGGSGADDLVGGSGIDQLTGGAGGDGFDFFSSSESGVGLGNRDRITDFQPGADRINLITIDAKAGAAGDQAFTFIGSNGFTAEGQVRTFIEGDHTVVALNTTGTGGAESQIELAGNVSLAAADFVL